LRELELAKAQLLQEVDKLNALLLDREKTMISLKAEQQKTQAENKKLHDQVLNYEILDTERQALQSDVYQLQ
jgi:chromosome segregation ATPase